MKLFAVRHRLFLGIVLVGIVGGALTVGLLTRGSKSAESLDLREGLVTVAQEPSLQAALDKASGLAGFTVVAPGYLPQNSQITTLYVDPNQRGFKVVMINVPGKPGFGLQETNSAFSPNEAFVAIPVKEPGVRVYRDASAPLVSYTMFTATRGFVMSFDTADVVDEAEVLKVLLSFPLN